MYKKKNKKKNGFTLVELLAIIAIIAIIATITVPIVLGIIDNLKREAAIASVRGVEDAIKYNHYSVISKNDTFSGDYAYNCDIDGCVPNINGIS